MNLCKLVERLIRTTSHLTNPAEDAGQVIGYGHSTRLADEIRLLLAGG